MRLLGDVAQCQSGREAAGTGMKRGSATEASPGPGHLLWQADHELVIKTIKWEKQYPSLELLRSLNEIMHFNHLVPTRQRHIVGAQQTLASITTI